jgi:hypothetical protein
MNIHQHVVRLLAIAILVGLFFSPTWAQEAKPKPEKPKPPATAKPEKKPDAKQPPAEPEVPPPEDAAVVAILATKPTTPAECILAAKRLVDLGHADVAKSLLKKVVAAKLTPQQLADLGEQFGSPMFLDWTSNKALLPEAKQLADAIVPAVKAKLEDSKRIAGLIAQLQDPVAEKRVEAMAGLQAAGQAAINPLVQVLADPVRTSEYTNVRTVLAGMGRSAREPLIACAIQDSNSPGTRIQAILALRETNDFKAAIYLLAPCLSPKSDPAVREAAAETLKQWKGHVPTLPEAVGLLHNAAKDYFERRQPIESIVDGRVELCLWDLKHNYVVRSVTPDDAARGLAALFASDAYALAPENRDIRLLCLAAALDLAAYAKGLDQPSLVDKDATDAKEKYGVRTIEEVLTYAMAQDHPAAATAAAQLLGQIGKADELIYQGDKPAPLVLALQDPDRRLRMAALEAIVRLKPSKPFAGSSDVPKALAYFAASSGVRHALVGGSNLAEDRDLAGMLAAAKFQTDTATTGRQLLLLATSSPDFEVAWIDVAINHPEINLLMQELRRDPRTALLRVGLVARSGNFELAEQLAAHDPMAKAFARPHDEQAFRWQLDQLTALASREFVDFGVRQQQAAEALDLLAELSQTSSKLYDLRGIQDAVLVALYNPKLAVKAAAVLANLNSAECQRALADMASRFVQPLATRQAAASAFRQSVQKYGILLTTEEIGQQYQRYNESEKQDAATQKVLGLILDCLEVPTAKGFRGQGSGFSTPNHTAAPNADSRTPNPEP